MESTLTAPKLKMRGKIVIAAFCVLSLLLCIAGFLSTGFYYTRFEDQYSWSTKLNFEFPNFWQTLWCLLDLAPIVLLAVYVFVLYKFPKASLAVTGVILLMVLANLVRILTLCSNFINMAGVYSFVGYYNYGSFLRIPVQISWLLQILGYLLTNLFLLVAAFGTLKGMLNKIFVVAPMLLAAGLFFLTNLGTWFQGLTQGFRVLLNLDWYLRVGYLYILRFLSGFQSLGILLFYLGVALFVALNVIYPVLKIKLTGSPAKKLKTLQKQHNAGFITDEEFELQRAEIIASL